MKRMAYFKIKEDMTPRDASDILALAKKSGFDDVVVFHTDYASMKAKYKEQLLSVLRGAYRHKVKLYFADDSYAFSGTGFGQLCSVRDLWQKVLVVKDKANVTEDDCIVKEKDGLCIVAELPEPIEKYPFGHFPDLTNPTCAEMVIDFVYSRFLAEYVKFSGYELQGFLCNCPVYSLGEYTQIPYSKEACEMYKGDLFVALEKDASEYLAIVRSLMEKNFVLPLKQYCEAEKMQFLLGSCPYGASTAFAKAEDIPLMDTCGLEGSYYPWVESAYDALVACERKAEPMVKIGYGMDKIKNIGRIFEEYPDCVTINANEITTMEKSCYILKNPSEESLSLGFLFEGEWCVYDYENDELYDFDKKTTYTIYPKGFLCVLKKDASMYTDKLPVRVGGVVTWDFEECGNIVFEQRDNKYAFYLPDEPLADKALLVETNAEHIKAKLSSMEHILPEKPHIAPLFDFQRDGGCLIEAIGGEIEKIVLITKKQME